ncbi:MAG: glutamate dehydrogenase, partial [Nitriliruptor sp.]
YGRKYGHTPQIVTGKPIALGGSYGRTEATGRGVVMTMDEAVSDAGLGDPSEVSVAVQGFGNVGSWAARIAAEEGYRIVAVSDIEGGIHVPGGINIDQLVAHVADTGTVTGFPGSDAVSNESLLELDVDVLIPAAIGEVITTENADRIQARIVVEGANHPTTPVADRILGDRGITVVPDILANAGGVTVSYYEWVQNNQEMRWSLEDVNRRLEAKLRRAYQQCRQFQSGHEGLSLREAGFSLAVARVVEAAELRGYI